MKRSRLLIVLLPLVLAACETGTPDDTKPGASVPPAAPVASTPAPTPTAPAPVATTPTPTAATTRVALTVGVPACDDYVAAYRACLTSGRVKGEQREALRVALQDQLRAWQSGSVPDLAGACQSARAVARNTFAQYGCDKL